jgi:hypothetical protein
MSDLKLTKTRLLAGSWEGVLTGHTGDDAPVLQLSHQTVPVDGLVVEKVDDVWHVKAPIPVDLIADGVQVFVITDAQGETLNHFTLISGEALADDIRVEVALLREELDMLKRAFRRHCLETASD